jgi:hypothetical protein
VIRIWAAADNCVLAKNKSPLSNPKLHLIMWESDDYGYGQGFEENCGNRQNQPAAVR